MFLLGPEASRLVSPLSPGSVQPAGVDLSVDVVEELAGPGFLGLYGRGIPQGRPLEAVGGAYRLGPGGYRVRFREVVRVPLWAVGFCLPRSSLLRMGASLHCAVWDPGYEGRGQALLVVYNPHGVTIEAGARVAQIVFARLEGLAASGYSGAYQGEGLGGRVGVGPRRAEEGR